MLFTGYADIQAVINAVNEGHIFRYILKPWDSAELEGIIRQGVEQYELLAERRRLIAELQTANAQLLEANGELARAGQLKTAFIEVASHEFNTPITLVLGLAELLRLANPDRSDQEQEILRQITGQRPSTRPAGHQHADPAPGRGFPEDPPAPARRRLSELIQRVVDQVRPFLHVRRLQLQVVKQAEDLGTFEIDADKISAVLINLLTNAIKFTPDVGPNRAEGPAQCGRRGGDRRRGPGRRPGAAGARAPVPAVLHPVRPQPALVGRFRLLQARARSGPEHRQAIRGDAWRADLRRERGDRGDAGDRHPAP